MKICNSALPFINMQRSGYLDLKKDFVTDMQKEFEEMKPFLPKKCESILDIGCGLGAIDILLSWYYGNYPRLSLADKSKVDETIHYGFKKNGSFYNSFDVLRELFELNGVGNYCLICAEKGDDIKGSHKQDLILSLLSCGYHYPVETYLERIFQLLADDGCLIIDIRDTTYGVDQIREVLPNVRQISHYNKSYRICARKG